ncbi:MAG: hypothetical protein PHD10_01975 [Bacilli bacterium]|nr:hypothetical protein [Bacilli bacterium]MDD4607891.1 hypothetical protein [Bacilli bacterium]
MILFSKDKEIIFKITNAILLIWLIAAIVIATNSMIKMVVKEPTFTYEEYKYDNCGYLKNDLQGESTEEDCEISYNRYKNSLKNSDYYEKITLYTSIANVVIVGGTLFFINSKKETNKKK